MTPLLPSKRIILRVLALTAVFGSFLPVLHATSRHTFPTTGQYGVASWHAPYGRECRTASHRLWVGSEMVAAHRTLPLGTKVRVVNLSNGREVVVQITDRGPYARGRIIDVSLRAANQLGLMQAGTARVRVETLPPEVPRAPNRFVNAARGGLLLEQE